LIENETQSNIYWHFNGDTIQVDTELYH